MRRRAFIAASVAVAASGRSLIAAAQQAEVAKRVGFLMPSSSGDRDAEEQFLAFRDALKQLGWAPGRNLLIDARWSPEPDRIRALAKELIEQKPDVIVGRSTAVTAILRQEAISIPIVFITVSDPVGEGIVKTFAHPGGNATGFTNVEASLGGKWLELLREIDPDIKSVAVMFGANTSAGNGTYYTSLIAAAAASIGVAVAAAPIHSSDDIDRALDILDQPTGSGLIVTPDLITTANRKAAIVAAQRRRIPAVFPFRHAVREGALLSYGVDTTDLFRRSADYVDRILRGAHPADLPVQAPTKFELAINLKTAGVLGIKVPPMLLARADEVME